MWMEENDPRVNTERFDQIYSNCAEPSTIGGSCPICKTMLTDASKARNKNEQVQIKDVVELVAEQLQT